MIEGLPPGRLDGSLTRRSYPYLIVQQYMSRYSRVLLDHIELGLSVAGLVAAITLPQVFGAEGMSFWRAAAAVAMVVGLIHGFIFWAVRYRQRQARRESIREIREMLSDVVKNELTAIDMYLPIEEQTIVRQELDGIRRSIERIAGEVDTLSEETIHRWKRKYDGAIRHTTTLSPASESDLPLRFTADLFSPDPAPSDAEHLSGGGDGARSEAPSPPVVGIT